ncbi:hypothetical protein BGZ82_001746 [Podila clonocystis]|nr:hypothetical protein BGZ82_001746 [Podila clonocystis]
MTTTSQKFKLGSTERELDLTPARVLNESSYIYVDDVLEAFKIPDADMFEADGRTIAYMQDGNGTIIPCHPGRVIQVVYETPQSHLTLFASIIAVDQLNIKRNVSTELDPSGPLIFDPSRKSTMQIQEDMKVVSNAMIYRNRFGKSLDAHSIIEESLPIEYNKSVAASVTATSGFESPVINKRDGLYDQGDMTQLIARDVWELQEQTNNRLVLIQSKTEAILTQQLELAEYPIPWLFIVLPEEPTKYDPGNWFKTKFRLHFVCECGMHTEASNSKAPHHVHLAKHEGYLVREPTEFFEKYGPFLLVMLELIKVGTSIAGHIVPTLVSPKVVELTNSVKQTAELVMAKIDYSLECINKQLVKAQASFPGNFNDTELRAAMTQQDLANYLGDVKCLEGVELRQLGSFLKTTEENLLGNLYRMTTSDGHVKWVCHDHYRASYQEKHTQKLRDVVKLAQGEFDEQLGRITITLTSSFVASEFYNAVIKARSIGGKKIGKLAEALKTNSTLTTLDLEGNSIGENRAQALAEALKTNSTLTTLNLSSNAIGENGAQALAEALKTNSTLTTLDLGFNAIGENGAQALAEALKTNATLTTLGLLGNSIGEKGAQALAEALKTNSTLTIMR